MFTRRNMEVPVLVPGRDTEDRIHVLEQQYRRLLDALVADRLALNLPGAIDISDAVINATNGIKFQATKNASSDANTLDDYEEAGIAPTPVAGTGSFTTVAASFFTTAWGNRVAFDLVVSITTNGTAATHIAVPTGFTPAVETALAGSNVTTNNVLSAKIKTDGSIYIYTAAGAYPGADATVLRVSGVFRV